MHGHTSHTEHMFLLNEQIAIFLFPNIMKDIIFGNKGKDTRILYTFINIHIIYIVKHNYMGT